MRELVHDHPRRLCLLLLVVAAASFRLLFHAVSTGVDCRAALSGVAVKEAQARLKAASPDGDLMMALAKCLSVQPT